MFRIKPHTYQRYLEGSKKNLAHSSKETELDLPLRVCVPPAEPQTSSDLPREHGLAAADLGVTARGKSPLGEGYH